MREGGAVLPLLVGQGQREDKRRLFLVISTPS